MAKRRYDLCVPRKGRDKTFWQKVGTMFEDGDRKVIKMDSIPVGAVTDPHGNEVIWDGWLKVFEQTEGGRSSAPSSGRQTSRGSSPTGDDDSVPW